MAKCNLGQTGKKTIFNAAIQTIILLLSLTSFAQVVTTVAGGGTNAYIGDGAPATNAVLVYVDAVAVDTLGNIYFADSYHNRIRKVNAAGILSTIAGSGVLGFSGDGGPATAANMNQPNSVAVDLLGNVYFSDYGNNRIRKINTAGIITTIGGTGTTGSGAINGPATAMSLYEPNGCAVDKFGNVFFCDNMYDVVKIDTTGIIRNVAGGGAPWYFYGDGGPATLATLDQPNGVAIGNNGNMYISDRDYQRIRKVDGSNIITTIAGNGTFGGGFSGDGGPATAAELNYPNGVSIDLNENVFIADMYNGRIRKVDLSGMITTVAGNGSYSFSGDGASATDAGVPGANGVAVDIHGNIIIADGDRIRKVNASGIITTVAGGAPTAMGSGGPATIAELYGPRGLVIDSANNILFADNNWIRKVTPVGIITTIAGNGLSGYGDGGLAKDAQSPYPIRITYDKKGNLYITEGYFTNRIRKIDPFGIITTIAGSDSAGFGGDGGPATAALLNYPFGIAIDKIGNIFFADKYNNRIRKIDTFGIISTFASIIVGAGGNDTIFLPTDVAVDTNGNVFFIDDNYSKVREINTIGAISTVAGGVSPYSPTNGALATNVSISPQGVTVDEFGNLFIADAGHNMILKVNGSGIITIMAGTGTAGYNGDGVASLTELNTPHKAVLDKNGIIYFSDFRNNMIRKIGNASSICVGSTSNFSASPPLGTWYSSNPSIATVDISTGIVSGIALGTDTISYSIGSEIQLFGVKIELGPVVADIQGPNGVCIDSNIFLTDSSIGGYWGKNNYFANIYPDGMVKGVSPGIDTIKYSFSNTCGVVTTYYPITVFNKGQCDSAQKVDSLLLQLQGVYLFPNPNYGIFTIGLPKSSSIASTFVYNLYGKVIYQTDGKDKKALEIDIRDFGPGTYVVKCISEKGVYYGKVSVY